MLNTRTVGGHRPRSNAPTPVIPVGGTEGRQPGSLFSVQLIPVEGLKVTALGALRRVAGDAAYGRRCPTPAIARTGLDALRSK
jgi:hypothetical protein